MACTSCQNTNNTFTYSVSTPCPDCGCTDNSVNSCDPCRTSFTDSSKIVYTGSPLSCIGLESGATQEEINQALDERICQELGLDISSFNTYCLENLDESQITTLQQFIEAASLYMCTTQEGQETVINNFNTFVTNITNLVTEASASGVDGTCTGIVIGDTNDQVFTKLDTKICSIDTAINPSSANWNNCGFSVGTAPTSVLGGFNKILDYICQVKSLIPTATTLPTFNNVGSCLPAPVTTTDNLTTTINKIKTKLCSIDYDLTGFNFGCIDGASTLHDVLQNTMDRVNEYQIYNFDATYFTITNVNNSFPCLGQNITINAAGLDKKVGANISDTTPGYLSDKLQAGDNTILDYSTTPGKVIITSIGDHKVLVNGSDSAPDYLDTKIDGVADTTGAITLVASANGGNNKVILTPTIDYTILAQTLLSTISSNSTLSDLFCDVSCGCNCESIPRTVNVKVNTLTAQDIYEVKVAVSQQTPTLAWYDSGNLSLGQNTSLASGNFTITSVASNPTYTINIKNNSVSVSHTYNWSVVDSSNNPVTGASSGSSTVAPGSTMNIPGNLLGTSVNAYTVIINFV